jgi:hypothetical protein
VKPEGYSESEKSLCVNIQVYKLRIRFGTFLDGIEDLAVDRSGQILFLPPCGVKPERVSEPEIYLYFQSLDLYV